MFVYASLCARVSAVGHGDQKKAPRSLGPGVADCCEPPDVDAGMELRSSAGAVRTLNAELSPTPTIPLRPNR